MAAGATAAAGVALATGLQLPTGNALEIVRSTRRDGIDQPPLRIALIADLHAPHNWVDAEEVAVAVRAFEPDLLFVVGDSIDRRHEESQVRIFDALSARRGKFAALGNHEYWSRCDLRLLRREYERAGVRLLVNEAAAVEVGGRPIQVIGLDDWRSGAPDYRLVADPRPGWRVAARRLVLAHCPVTFDAIREATNLPLDVFAGHTHGGQIAPFGTPLVLPRGSGRYVRGWYASSDPRQRLYVSRGLGNSGVPFRIGARPELALLTL